MLSMFRTRITQLSFHVFLALTVGLSAGGTAHALDQGYGFVLADQPTTASYTASGSKAYNVAGGDVLINRSGTGVYSVTFFGFTELAALSSRGGTLPSVGGNVQVTSVGTSGRTCQVNSWLTETVHVRCFDASGIAADSEFSLLYLLPEDSARIDHYAYMWVHDSVSTTYTPDPLYSLNPASGAMQVSRVATGIYELTWTGWGAYGYSTNSHVQVTAYGSTPARCVVEWWGGDTVRIYCFDPSGSPVSSQFSVVYWRPVSVDFDLPHQGDKEAAFAWANYEFSTSYTPATSYAFNPLNLSDITAERLGVGEYRINIAGLSGVTFREGNVQVSAYADIDHRCQVESWAAGVANVRCHDSLGAAVDTKYTILYLIVPRSNWFQSYAFATSLGTPNATPLELHPTPPHSSYSAVGDSILRHYEGVGRYRIEIPGMDGLAGQGNVQVSTGSVGLQNHCGVRSWSGNDVNIDCYAPTATLSDTEFYVFYAKAQAGDQGLAYALADQPTTASYAPISSFAHHPHGGAITVTRSATGTYQVLWSGLLPPSTVTHPLNLQVTRHGAGNSHRCGGSVSWALLSGDVTANVFCETVAGVAADSEFSVFVALPDEKDRSIMLAETCCTPGSETIVMEQSLNPAEGPMDLTVDSALRTKRFQADGYHDVPSYTGIPLLTSKTPGVRCIVDQYNAESVVTRCLDSANNSTIDSLESILFLRAHPVPEPGMAISLVVGAAFLAIIRRGVTHAV